MKENIRLILTNYREDTNKRYRSELQRLSCLPGYESKRMRLTHDKQGRSYYYVSDQENVSYKYLGTEKHPEVLKIKEAHYLKDSLKVLGREIRLLDNILKNSVCSSYEEINQKLSPAYRDAQIGYNVSGDKTAALWKQRMESYKATFPPYREEEKIHRTRDGTYVRSRGEALIYNDLLDMGVTFVYELPLRIRYGSKSQLLFPDFTILTDPETESVIYIEHQGMMGNPAYRNKFNESIYKYWLNNYIPERDVFFTFDPPNGGFDDSPISDIIRSRVKPQQNYET